MNVNSNFKTFYTPVLRRLQAMSTRRNTEIRNKLCRSIITLAEHRGYYNHWNCLSLFHKLNSDKNKVQGIFMVKWGLY